MTPWAKMPSRWIQADHGLKAFGSKDAGTNAAALKVYMALALFANFSADSQFSGGGWARLSFSDLEKLCGISRQSVNRGVAVLVSAGLIRNGGRQGNVNCYELQNYDVQGWAKIPKSYLLGKADGRGISRFAELPIRGGLHLDALKLYMALLTFRPNDGRITQLSYDKIEAYTGIARRRIRAAIDVLVNYQWISLTTFADGFEATRPSNAYVLRGDFWGKRRRDYARASTPVREEELHDAGLPTIDAAELEAEFD